MIMENEKLILQLAKIIVAQSEQISSSQARAPRTRAAAKTEEIVEAVDLAKVSAQEFNDELFRRYPKLLGFRTKLAEMAQVRTTAFYSNGKNRKATQEVMSAQEVFQHLPACYSVYQIYDLIRDQKIPYKKSSKCRYYFAKKEIDEWYSGEGYALLAPSRSVGGAPVSPDELPAKKEVIPLRELRAQLATHPSDGVIYRWVKAGMPYYYWYGQMRFVEKEVREWLRQCVYTDSELKLKL